MAELANLLFQEAACPPHGIVRLWFFNGDPLDPVELERPKWCIQDHADEEVARQLAAKLARDSKQSTYFRGTLVLDSRGKILYFTIRSRERKEKK